MISLPQQRGLSDGGEFWKCQREMAVAALTMTKMHLRGFLATRGL